MIGNLLYFKENGTFGIIFAKKQGMRNSFWAWFPDQDITWAGENYWRTMYEVVEIKED